MIDKTDKEEIRKWAKELRKRLDLKKISTEITNKIKHLEEYKKARNVMSYLAKDVEISLINLFEDITKSWYLPAVMEAGTKDPQIVVVPYIHNKTKLIKGNFGVLEPEIIDNSNNYLDLIFVPGLCFDKEGNRLGFGKGYYDKFLKLNPKSFKIGCCPKECLVEKLPTDLWDEKVDIVIVES